MSPSLLRNTQTLNEFDAIFGFATHPTYPDPPSGPDSPPYSHTNPRASPTSSSPDDYHPSSLPPTARNPHLEPRRRKPGARKTVQPGDQILKRRVQNRAAQRSFRERQKEYVHELEHQVAVLKGEIGKLHEDYRVLSRAVTSAPAIQAPHQGEGSPATSWREVEGGDEMGLDLEGLEPVTVEGNLWRSSMDHGGVFY